MFKVIQSGLRSCIVVAFGSLTAFFLGMAWFVLGVHIPGREVDTRMAFWMQHNWSTEQHPDFGSLYEQTQSLPITDLYFHVGPIDENGQLAEDINVPTAGMELLGTTNYAWLGQIRAKIDLDDPVIRQNIIESSAWIINQGFDGIHFDIEPVRPDDEGFFLLVEELHATFPELPISVAMDEWQPESLSQLLSWHLDLPIESYWPTEQVERVAESASQIVVMTYDTGFHDGRVYTWWVEQQTIALSKIMPKDTELFIGIPSYEQGTAFDPAAENVENGLLGFQRAVQNLRTQRKSLAGVAIYPYWEMDSHEWSQLEHYAADLR